MKTKIAEIKHRFVFTNIQTKDGVVINERCRCGALKTQHDQRLAMGHGPCPETQCRQFTWDSWVMERGA